MYQARRVCLEQADKGPERKGYPTYLTDPDTEAPQGPESHGRVRMRPQACETARLSSYTHGSPHLSVPQPARSTHVLSTALGTPAFAEITCVTKDTWNQRSAVICSTKAAELHRSVHSLLLFSLSSSREQDS